MSRPGTDALVALLRGLVAVATHTGVRDAKDLPGTLLSAWLRPPSLRGAVQALRVLSSVVLIAVAGVHLAYLVQAGAFSTLRPPRAPAGAGDGRAASRKRGFRADRVPLALLAMLFAMGLLLLAGGEPLALPTSGAARLHVWLAWALVATILFHLVARHQVGAATGQARAGGAPHGADRLLGLPRPGRPAPSSSPLP